MYDSEALRLSDIFFMDSQHLDFFIFFLLQAIDRKSFHAVVTHIGFEFENLRTAVKAVGILRYELMELIYEAGPSLGVVDHLLCSGIACDLGAQCLKCHT